MLIRHKVSIQWLFCCAWMNRECDSCNACDALDCGWMRVGMLVFIMCCFFFLCFRMQWFYSSSFHHSLHDEWLCSILFVWCLLVMHSMIRFFFSIQTTISLVVLLNANCIKSVAYIASSFGSMFGALHVLHDCSRMIGCM
eukprot:219744_1